MLQIFFLAENKCKYVTNYVAFVLWPYWTYDSGCHGRTAAGSIWPQDSTWAVCKEVCQLAHSPVQ